MSEKLCKFAVNMEFRTIVTIPQPSFAIEPFERMLFVGSCFADHIGRRFVDDCFCATVNPYGVMYNPASVLHTVERQVAEGRAADLQTVFITLGTNHVYVLNATGEIVDNCQKRPQRLFTERVLTIDECADYLRRAVALLQKQSPNVRIVLTVSPIRYRKYGYHESLLSKATLLLAAQRLVDEGEGRVAYFPAYEIVNDELRDYRFYAPDMLHPSEQAVDYIWERLVETYLSPRARTYINEWHPVKAALAHRPFQPDCEEHRVFQTKTQEKLDALKAKYPELTEVLQQPINDKNHG